MRRNIAAGRCRRDQLAQAVQKVRWQDLFEVLLRKTADPRVWRSDALERGIQRLTAYDRGKQSKDMFEVL